MIIDKNKSKESSSNGNNSCNASIPRYKVNNENAMVINLSCGTFVFLYADAAINVKSIDKPAMATVTEPAIRSSCVTISIGSSNGLK